MKLKWKKASVQAWLPTVSLGFAAFIFVTTEMLPVGLLPDMAASFGKTESYTGLLLTIYAWMVAFMSLPLTILSAKINRRHLVFILLGVFIVGNILSAVANSFIFMMGARICIALAHSVFWSIATPLAVRVAPPGKKARALSIVIVGASLAAVLGVPIGTLAGHYLGWRLAFGLVAATAAVIAFILYKFLPSEPAQNTGSFRSLNVIFHKKNVLQIYALTLIVVIGHFTLFTYFSPFITRLGGFSSDMVAFLLLILGGASVFGSVLGSKYAEKSGRKLIVISLACLTVLLSLLNFAVLNIWIISLAVIIWGAAFTLVSFILQFKIMTEMSEAADVAISIFSGTYNIGIGGGALLGSFVFASAGIEYNAWLAALLLAAGTVLASIRISQENLPVNN